MKKEINKTRIILFIVAVISFIIHLFIYPKLPAQIPIQWSSTGEVNTYGAKYMDLVIAGIPVLIVPLMVIMPKIDPRKANYAKHGQAYTIAMTGITLLLIGCSWLSALSALGYDVHIETVLSAAMGILFIAIGNSMPQIRSNYFFGIRTPWTLENPDVWRKTHRFGGILFCIMGVLFIIDAFFKSEIFSTVLVVILAVGSVALTYLYSYILYRKLG